MSGHGRSVPSAAATGTPRRPTHLSWPQPRKIVRGEKEDAETDERSPLARIAPKPLRKNTFVG